MRINLDGSQKNEDMMGDVDEYLEDVQEDLPNIKSSFETIRDILNVIESEIESSNKITRASAFMASYRLFKHYRSFMLEMIEMKKVIRCSIEELEIKGVKNED